MLKNLKNKVSILLLFILLITGCKKKQAYLFNNNKYYSVFEDESKIFNILKKNLMRNFYDLNIINIKSFLEVEPKINKILQEKKETLFFLENFLSPILIKNENINIKNNKIKLITYNIDINNEVNISFPTFNIKVDHKLIEKKIFKLLKNISEKKDFSDCGIIINPDTTLGNEIINSLNESSYKIDILKIYSKNINIIKNFLDNKKRKAVILLSYNSNDFVLDLKDEKYNDTTFIELFTNYGELDNKIKYKIDINWMKAFETALNSRKFKFFINNTGLYDKENKYFEYIIENKVIFIKEYNDIKYIEVNDNKMNNDKN